jgi:hypothetical protein
MPVTFLWDFLIVKKRLNAKFKNLRRSIKLWAKNLPFLKHLISNFNEVILFIDTLEEFGSLSLIEWNLRDILKNHVITLPQNQKSYWKQIGKIKWVNLGDANTKIFHTRASINFRHIYIFVLKNDNQAKIYDHDGKLLFSGMLSKREWVPLTLPLCSST